MQYELNKIHHGNNLDILHGIDSDCIDLIYLDPPFNSKRNYKAPIGSAAEGAEFKDIWTDEDVKDEWHGQIAVQHEELYQIIQASQTTYDKSMRIYLTTMAIRLFEMKRILKPTGSIYLHCDPTASHYLKLIMDDVFGRDNFQNEIVWHYKTSSGKPQKHFIKNTDTLLFYSNESGKNIFNVIKEPWPEATLRKWQKDENGIYRMNNGKKYYIDPRGKNIDNVWEITLSSRSKERTGYPTQKPLKLLERIIKASSNEGDVILDPFCGSGTTLVAANNLGRRYIGIDQNPKAIKITKERLKQLNLFTSGIEDAT